MEPGRFEALLRRPVRRLDPVGGGSICRAYRAVLDGGTIVFAKELPDAADGLFAAEAEGLAWLGTVAGVRVPEILAVADDAIVLAWVEPGRPTMAGAENLGRALARLHRAGADGFGAGWPGYIGPLPLDNTRAPAWNRFYAEQRVLPYLHLAVDRGAMSGTAAATVERVAAEMDRLAGPPEPPSRIHGDLWSGNVHWDTAGEGWLVDPAAHGGHRETDLAMLALFGAPQLERILGAYQEEFPLADGWRQRVPLHQLHPLLVHAALFGGGYGAQAADAATRALRLAP